MATIMGDNRDCFCGHCSLTNMLLFLCSPGLFVKTVLQDLYF